MPIENRSLEAGMRFAARYKKETYLAEVVETPEGLRFRLEDGREFKSLSSAGKAITGGAVNGWRFWSAAGEDPQGQDASEGAEEDRKHREGGGERLGGENEDDAA